MYPLLCQRCIAALTMCCNVLDCSVRLSLCTDKFQCHSGMVVYPASVLLIVCLFVQDSGHAGLNGKPVTCLDAAQLVLDRGRAPITVAVTPSFLFDCVRHVPYHVCDTRRHAAVWAKSLARLITLCGGGFS